jgi:hypothetical protein
MVPNRYTGILRRPPYGNTAEDEYDEDTPVVTLRMTTDNSAVAKRRNPCCLRKAHRRILGGPKASFNKAEISLLLNGRSGRDLYVATSLIDTAFYSSNLSSIRNL